MLIILIILVILVTITIITLSSSIHFLKNVRVRPLKLGAMLYEREVLGNRFNLNTYNNWPKECFHIPSTFGYHIAGTIIAPHQTNKYIIICHGITVNQLNSIKYAELFISRGFNVITYDHRRHGLSGGKSTTYGFYEKWDLKSIVDFVYQRFGNNILLGIHGESMGASTLLLYAGELEDRCDFYIADCPFSDLDTLLTKRIRRDYHLPRFPFIPLVNYIWKKKDGCGLEGMSPIKSVHNIHNPVWFAHTIDDPLTASFHSEDLHIRKNKNSRLSLFPKGTHACSLTHNRAEYEEQLDVFLNECVYAQIQPAND